jgi:hypothetical protein
MAQFVVPIRQATHITIQVCIDTNSPRPPPPSPPPPPHTRTHVSTSVIKLI